MFWTNSNTGTNRTSLLGIAMLSLLGTLAACVDIDVPTASDVAVVELGQPINGGLPAPPALFSAVGQVGGCSGTLISQSAVLTAAHCFCDHEAANPLSTCQARTTFRLEDQLIWSPAGLPQIGDAAIPGDVHVHPGYDGVTRDFAIVELDTPADTTLVGVPPMIVAPRNRIPSVGDTLTVVGYGLRGELCTETSTGKQFLAMVVDAIDWDEIEFWDTNEHACFGDSGGPALNAQAEIAGVAYAVSSVGEDETLDYVGSVYQPTHAPDVSDWIGSFLDEQDDDCTAASSVALSAETDAAIDFRGDVDVFRIDLAHLTHLTAQSTGDTDTYGTLLDASCSPLADDDDLGDQRNFEIHRTLDPGTYYLSVRHYSPAGWGPYTLDFDYVVEMSFHEPDPCEGGTLGGRNYCSVECPCDVGGGDCDSDAECVSGLYCARNVGADYGFRRRRDVCELDCHVGRLGGRNYCSAACPCREGEGDCDSDSECRTGLIWAENVGRY